MPDAGCGQPHRLGLLYAPAHTYRVGGLDTKEKWHLLITTKKPLGAF